jgi:hypothetical protein
MKNKYIIGGLVVLGGLALWAWYKKPKKNSDGFFNAGGTSKLAPHRRCYCKTSNGSLYISDGEKCNGSDKCTGVYTGVY